MQMIHGCTFLLSPKPSTASLKVLIGCIQMSSINWPWLTFSVSTSPPHQLRWQKYTHSVLKWKYRYVLKKNTLVKVRADCRKSWLNFFIQVKVKKKRLKCTQSKKFKSRSSVDISSSYFCAKMTKSCAILIE